MKKIAILIVFVCGFSTVYSQPISLQSVYDKMCDDHKTLQNSVKMLKDSIAKIIDKHRGELSTLNITISEINKKLEKVDKKVAALNRNTDTTERNNLLQQVKVLITDTTDLRKQLSEKKTQIARIEAEGQRKEQEKYKAGQQDVLSRSYQGDFNNLIKSSTKLSIIECDMQLVDKAEVKQILEDLLVYFNTEELLTKKFDAAIIKNAQTQLNQIKQKSGLLDKLKDNIEYYQDFNNALKETIGKLVDLDKRKKAGVDAEIQKMKFAEIVTELTKYMYDYYDYGNYPYLYDIMLEIIKRKRADADMDISDLLRQL
jgi:hypothetical protein